MAPQSLQAIAEEQQKAALERQQLQSDLRNHVDGCVEGQKRVEKRFDVVDRRFDAVDHRFDGMDSKLDAVLRAQDNAKTAADAVAATKLEMTRPRWWHPLAGWAIRGVIGGACVLIVFLATALWKDQQQITSLQRQPATAVTVNPAPAAPAPNPAPIPVTPPTPAPGDTVPSTN